MLGKSRDELLVEIMDLRTQLADANLRIVLRDNFYSQHFMCAAVRREDVGMRDQEKMREDFEAQVNKLELGTAKRDGEYVRADVRDMWRLWQASRTQADAAHKEEIAVRELKWKQRNDRLYEELDTANKELARLRDGWFLAESKHKEEIAKLEANAQEYINLLDSQKQRLEEQLAAAQLAIEQKDAALKVADTCLSLELYAAEGNVRQEIAIALALAPSLSALKEHDAELFEQAGKMCRDSCTSHYKSDAPDAARRNCAVMLEEKASKLRAQSEQKKGGE